MKKEFLVFTGTLFIPEIDNKGRFCIFKRIGNNMFSIPTHVYKIILKQNDVECYVVTNRSINRLNTFDLFKQQLYIMEKLLGISIFDVDIDRYKFKDKFLPIIRKNKLITAEQATRIINFSDDFIDLKDVIFQTYHLFAEYLSVIEKLVEGNKTTPDFEEIEKLRDLHIFWNKAIVGFSKDERWKILSCFNQIMYNGLEKIEKSRLFIQIYEKMRFSVIKK